MISKSTSFFKINVFLIKHVVLEEVSEFFLEFLLMHTTKTPRRIPQDCLGNIPGMLLHRNSSYEENPGPDTGTSRGGSDGLGH